MRHRRLTIRGIAWFLINGIPLIVICIVGLFADFVGWPWLDRQCERWYEDILERSR